MVKKQSQDGFPLCSAQLEGNFLASPGVGMCRFLLPVRSYLLVPSYCGGFLLYSQFEVGLRLSFLSFLSSQQRQFQSCCD